MSETSVIRLYHCEDARSFRVLWTLEELQLPYELVMLPFPPRVQRPEYLETNPIGTVPFFVHGDLQMTESSAICQYLVDSHPETSLGVAPAERDYGSYLNWLHFGEATLTFSQAVTLRYTVLEPLERRQPQVALDYAAWFKGRLKAVERALPDGRLHLCSDRFTAADVSVGYALKLAERRGFAFEKFEHTLRYWRGLQVREGYHRAMERQADAMSRQGIPPSPAFQVPSC